MGQEGESWARTSISLLLRLHVGKLPLQEYLLLRKAATLQAQLTAPMLALSILLPSGPRN